MPPPFLYIVYYSLFVQEGNSPIILANEELVLRLYGNYSSTTCYARKPGSSVLALPGNKSGLLSQTRDFTL
jgi:hypothetical protein